MNEIVELIENKLIQVSSLERFITLYDLMSEVYDELSNEEYTNLVVNAYVSSDDLYHYREEVESMFSDIKFNGLLSMSEDERKLYDSLPNYLTVYRGMTQLEAHSGDYGFSWSLSKEKAEYFAYTYGRNYSTAHMPKTVVARNILKREIMTINSSRNEHEVLVAK